MSQTLLEKIVKIDPRLSQNEPAIFPSDEQELSRVLGALSNSGHTIQIVHPGTQPPSSISASADVVVNVSNLKQIKAYENIVHVGVSANIESLTDILESHKLFLPLSDVPVHSIFQSLSENAPGYYDLTVGQLRSFVTEINMVSFDGQLETLRSGSDKSKIEDLLNGVDTSVIVTSVVFKALLLSEISDLWLARLAFPYSKNNWDILNEIAFDANLPENVDVTVQTAKLFAGFLVVVLTMASKRDVHNPSKVLAKLTGLRPAAAKLLKESVVRGDSVLKEGLFSQGVGRHTWNKNILSRSFNISSADQNQVLAQLSNLLSEANSKTKSHIRIFPRLNLSLQISRAANGLLSVYTELHMPTSTIQEVESKYESKFKSFLPDSKFSDSYFPIILSKGPTSAKGKPDAMALLRLINPKETHIPDFSGPTYMQGDEDYTEKAKQYATSSYPSDRSTPFIVGYPQSVNDIKTAVAFAKANQKSIVARSGGHQYSCLSGGDQSVIVLSMDRFSYAETVDDSSNLVTVGSGTPLTHISKYLTDRLLTVPHGECPLVCVGGHTQSGGYGHTLRSQGLLVDYVRSFRIVLADCSYIEVFRPTVGAADKHVHNDDIYYGVLGGSPGSFGVVTEYTYEAVRDQDHPFSTGHSAIYMYEKERFRNLMEIVQEWTRGIKDDTWQSDIDMMVTAISFDLRSLLPESWHDQGSIPGPPPSDVSPSPASMSATETPTSSVSIENIKLGALQLELLYGNESGQPDTTNPTVGDRFNQMHLHVLSDDSVINLPYVVDFSSDEPHSLSFMCDSWVRRYGTTLDGREFVYPYQKRLNGTFDALSDEFVNGFVDLVDKVLDDRRVRMVFQMGLGGGKHRNNSNRVYTAAPRRDLIWAVVFDVFYTEGQKQIAINYQSEMKILLENTFPEKDQVRMFWGSFGDTDLNNVWSMYYDNEASYRRLQTIKQAVDGMDVFHTEFTVQLPS